MYKSNHKFLLLIGKSQLSWPRDFGSLDLDLDDKGFFLFFLVDR
jgi:hypothetical protein